MRDYLLDHPLSRGGRLWCDRLLQGVDEGRRDCLRLYPEALKWVGAQVNLYAVLLERVGARSEDELKQLVESGRRLESMTQDASTSLSEYKEEALALLLGVLKQKPEWRDGVVARLSSEAVEESTNGDG